MAERPEEPEAELDISSEPISPAAAIAIGVHRGRKRHATDPEFDAFLRKQGELVDLQKEHLHEQRQVILLRLRLGAWKDRVTLALQALTTLIGVAIAVAIAVMAWQAHEDHGLVVQPFSVPPDLAQRGLTGEVIASRLIDGISELQTKTYSARPASSYANDWGQDLKVEIPETGVSIGELNRWLRKELGHETTISGEVYRTPIGIAVAARAGVTTASIHTGSDANLDELVRDAAEDAYAATQPYRYAIYLAQSGQVPSARATMEALARSGDRTDRMWAYEGLSTSLKFAGDEAGALRAASSSIAVDPGFPIPYRVRGEDLVDVGHDQAALADLERADQLMHRNGRRYVIQNDLAREIAWTDSDLAAETGDFAKAAPSAEAVLTSTTSPTVYAFGIGFADRQARWHDVAAARQTENELLAPASAKSEVEVVVDAAAEDWPALLRAYAAVDPRQMPASFASELLPSAAMARAKLGDVAGARALIGTTPLDCYPCVGARGQIEAVAHDWAGADRWFADAVRQAPSIPFAYADWGQALLAKGDPDAAIVKLKQAHKLGPHYADPLEVWGEALMAKRDYASAIDKFAEADKDAPKWGRNHLRWGEALMLSGRYAEARAQYQIASGLDLSVGDHAALNLLLARTAKGPLHG